MPEFLSLKRAIGQDSTIGELYGPDGAFWCHTLEDVVRNVKIPGKTAIPCGEYEVVVSFSPKYQRLMPRLLDVPFYQGILIHPGNTPDHSEGCILVGKLDPSTPNFVGHSRDTFDRIFPLIRKLAEKGELRVKIEGGFAPESWIKEIPGAVS